MKTLLLMRHGDAPQARSDRERMLSELGKEQCREMSAFLEDLNIPKVITSDYQRAIDSASLVTKDLNANLAFFQEALLRPMANANEALNFLCDELEKLETQSSLLVVCHMPLISELASLAIDGNLRNHYSFPCASLMKLQTDFASLGCFNLLDHSKPSK